MRGGVSRANVRGHRGARPRRGLASRTGAGNWPYETRRCGGACQAGHLGHGKQPKAGCRWRDWMIGQCLVEMTHDATHVTVSMKTLVKDGSKPATIQGEKSSRFGAASAIVERPQSAVEPRVAVVRNRTHSSRSMCQIHRQKAGARPHCFLLESVPSSSSRNAPVHSPKDSISNSIWKRVAIHWIRPSRERLAMIFYCKHNATATPDPTVPDQSNRTTLGLIRD